MTDTVHLLGKQGTLIGVLSKPDSQRPRSDTAVIFLNSGLLHRIGPFRLYVYLARRLAERGIASIRIDQSGKGDSERRKGLSFSASVKSDFEDTIAFLESSVGARKFVVLGLCSGADDALYLASEYAQVVGAVLLEPYAFRTLKYYLRHYVPRLARLDVWVLWTRNMLPRLYARVRALMGKQDGDAEQSEIGAIREFVSLDEVRRRYRATLDHRCKLLCVFTDGSRYYYNYPGQLVASLHERKRRALITELYFPAAKHTFPLTRHRERLVGQVCEWLQAELVSERAPVETAELSPARSTG